MPEPTSSVAIGGLFLGITLPSGEFRSVNAWGVPSHSGYRALKIGRDARAQVQLEDPAVSRSHAVVEFSADGACLIDLGSGSRVNGASVNKTTLLQGDVIEVGDTKMEVLGFLGPPAPTQPPAAEVPTQPEPTPPQPPAAEAPKAETKTPQAPLPSTLFWAFGYLLEVVARGLVARGVRWARRIEAEDAAGQKGSRP